MAELNPSIILAGQQPDLVNALAGGLQAGQLQNDIRYQGDYRNALRQFGAGAMNGEQPAMNALAAYDPQMMLGMQQTRLGMDLARNEDQRADVRLEMDGQRLALAREEGQRAATRLAAELSAQERAEAADGAFRVATSLANAGSVEEANAILAENGVAGSIETMDDLPAAIAEFIGGFEGLGQTSFEMAMQQQQAANAPPEYSFQGGQFWQMPGTRADGPPVAVTPRVATGDMGDRTTNLPEGAFWNDPADPSQGFSYAQPSGAPPAGSQDFGAMDELSTAWRNEPQVKEFATQAAAMQRIASAAETDSGPGDIALIFSFMKLLDPTSVVREGEFATAENAGGVGERVINLYNSVLRGERLSPEMRQEFVRAAQDQYQGALRQYEGLRNQYTARAEARGFDPSAVITDYTYSPAPAAPPPQTGSGFQPVPQQPAASPQPAAPAVQPMAPSAPAMSPAQPEMGLPTTAQGGVPNISVEQAQRMSGDAADQFVSSLTEAQIQALPNDVKLALLEAINGR